MVLHVQEKLSSLDTYIATISYDIGKFNAYVKDLVDSLTAWGQVTKDLLVFLLKAYTKVPDKDFSNYICAKQNEYEEGHDLNPNILMTQANNKYKSLVQAQTWNAPSLELQKIMALEATIKQLKKKGKPNSNENKGKGNGKKGNNKKGKKGDKEDKPKLPAWMSKKPLEKDKNKSKTYNKKEWWLCLNHKKHCHHRPK